MQRQQGDAIPQHNIPAGASSSALARPPLVGRGAEMDRLAAQLSLTAGGQGCAMFLVGEADIGKTRLDRIYTRLGINSRIALVRYAVAAGLLPPAEGGSP